MADSTEWDWLWNSLAEWIIEGMLVLLDSMIWLVQNAPEPDVSKGNIWFVEQYGAMFQMGILLVLPLALVATIGAILKGGLAEVLKTYLVGIPVAILGTVVALSIITLMLRIDQAFCDALIGQLSLDYATFVDNVAGSDIGGDNVGMLFLLCVIFVFMAIGVLFLYAELIFRCVAIYMAVLFLPLGFAAYVWNGSRPWFSRLARMISALIMMKFVIVAALSFAFAAIRFSFGSLPAQNPDAGAMHIGALLAGLTAFFFAAMAGPALVGMVMGQDGVPGMGRKEWGKLSPMSADQRFARGEMGKLIPPKLRLRK